MALKGITRASGYYILQVIKCFWGITTANYLLIIEPEKASNVWKTLRKHGILPEMGLDGSVWAESRSGGFPVALGSLWDASRALKPPKNPKNPGFQGLGVRG